MIRFGPADAQDCEPADSLKNPVHPVHPCESIFLLWRPIPDAGNHTVSFPVPGGPFLNPFSFTRTRGAFPLSESRTPPFLVALLGSLSSLLQPSGVLRRIHPVPTKRMLWHPWWKSFSPARPLADLSRFFSNPFVALRRPSCVFVDSSFCRLAVSHRSPPVPHDLPNRSRCFHRNLSKLNK